MIVNFRYLCSIGVTHTYHGLLAGGLGAPCPDLEFLVPAATADILRGGRMQARQHQGRLYLLYEADDEEAPLVDLAGTTLLFGLRPRDPGFDSYTRPLFDDPRQRPLHANLSQPATLAAARPCELVSDLREPVAAGTPRPLTLTLCHLDGRLICQRLLTDHALSAPLPDDLADGLYTLTASAPGLNLSRDLCLSRELADAPAWAVLALRIDASHYTGDSNSLATAPAWDIALQARESPLQFCIVAPGNYPQSELDQLAIVDAGASEQQRDLLTFTRLTPADDDDDIRLLRRLGGNDIRIVLFSSPATRQQARGYRRLRLTRNGTVLIEHLPLPSALQSQSRMIIHLSRT